MGARVFASGVTLDGLDLSGVDDDGVEWNVSKLTGWSGSTASTLTVDQKAADHGGWGSPRPRFAYRVLTIEGTFTGSPRAVSLAADRLNTAVDLDPVKLVVDEGRRTRWALVQRQDEVLIDDTIETSYSYSVQLAQVDPFKYADPVVASTGLPRTSGGLAIPTGVPFSIDSDVASGQVVLTNPGNASGPVMLRIDGPITAPRIVHVGTGKALAFSTALTLADGEWLDVDMKNKTALANGTANRAGWITERGWSLFEQDGNTWAFTAAAPSATARLTVTATPAWR